MKLQMSLQQTTLVIIHPADMQATEDADTVEAGDEFGIEGLELHGLNRRALRLVCTK
jgi:hypothetical protein